MRNHIRRLFLVLAVAVLAGCATPPPKTALTGPKQQVSKVYLNEFVSVPVRMYYMGPGGANFMLFGALGVIPGAIAGAVAAPGLERSRAEFQYRSITEGTQIETIVLEEMRAVFAASGKLTLVPQSEAGGAMLTVSVNQYGFSIPNGFSSKLVPILDAEAHIKDGNGAIVWSDRQRSTPLTSPVEAKDAAAIQQDAAAREAAWREAARALARRMVATY
ncbi:MAG: hypothetical protein HYX47_05680 [Burkholderiales bacterium]|nr:hypothetical protein [Burkholderiales bacterium]